MKLPMVSALILGEEERGIILSSASRTLDELIWLEQLSQKALDTGAH